MKIFSLVIHVEFITTVGTLFHRRCDFAVGGRRGGLKN